jgi:hypothetical protein
MNEFVHLIFSSVSYFCPIVFLAYSFITSLKYTTGKLIIFFIISELIKDLKKLCRVQNKKTSRECLNKLLERGEDFINYNKLISLFNLKI